METMYTAVATATGGREGQVKTDNKVLDLEVRMPKALGGANDNYTNPEQLFAAGYAACFDSALNLVIKKAKIKTGTTTVTAQVSIGKTDLGFQLGVNLIVNIPSTALDIANTLSQKAHQICPYSNATRNNITVTIITTNN